MLSLRLIALFLHEHPLPSPFIDSPNSLNTSTSLLNLPMFLNDPAHVSLQTRLAVGDRVGGPSVLRAGRLRHRRRDLHGFERARWQVDDEEDAGLPEDPHEAKGRPHVRRRRNDAGER